MLGYVVKFYPEALRPFDTSVQSTIRGDLPQPLTAFFKTITVIGNPSTQAIIAAVAVIVLALKKMVCQGDLRRYKQHFSGYLYRVAQVYLPAPKT